MLNIAINFTTLASSPTQNFSEVLHYLLFAFLGGLILNLMPCVFPVIGIKVLSLLEEAEMRGRSKTLYSLMYSFGIIISLWTLFAIVVIAKSLGNQLGWGFQLQEPSFVAVLSLVFILLGFNFLGALEFRPAIRTKGTSKEDGHLSEAFLSGLLTTIVATPCTAPFMGASVAFALQATTFIGFVLFTSMGLGLSFPYLIFVVFPSALKFLPRPGAWMEILKRFFAFPLFGAAVWLLWVLGLQAGATGIVRALIAAVSLGFAVWIKYEFGNLAASKRSRRTSLIFFFAVCVFALFYVSKISIDMDQKNSDHTYVDNYGEIWEPYSKEIIERSLSAQKTVYLDLTASWCVTCQVNKAIVFGSEDVRNYIKQNHIVLVRGDWTTQDPMITEVIQSYGKAGVPLDILYRPQKPPYIFPSILTPSMVLDELKSP